MAAPVFLVFSHPDKLRTVLYAWADVRSTEQLMIIRMSLEVERLSDRVIPIGIPRPDSHWETVQSLYPPRRVLFFTNRNSFEAMKVAHWRSLGEAVQIIGAEGDLSGTLFKENVRSGGNWRSFLLAATIEYFVAAWSRNLAPRANEWPENPPTQDPGV
ncbi:MAG: hypothetical protein ACHBMF_02765 [Chromatiales bacterium]